jgi:hypothetical protein
MVQQEREEVEMLRKVLAQQEGFCYLAQGIQPTESRVSTQYPTASELVRAGYSFGVEQAGPGFWHAVEFSSVFLGDIPGGDRVGSDALLRAVQAKAYEVSRPQTRAQAARAWSNRVESFEENNSILLNAMELVKLTAESSTAEAEVAVGGALRGAGHKLHSGMENAMQLVCSLPTLSRARRLVHEGEMFVWQRMHAKQGASWRYLSPLDISYDPAAVQVPGIDHFKRLSEVDAIEATKILNTAVDSMGEAATRMATALDTYKNGIVTRVPPSSPNYAKLVQLLGPLAYRAAVEAHSEAATFRRAALAHSSRVFQGARVGLVSPSTSEMHTFPGAAIWRYDDGQLDRARFAKHCTLCKRPDCLVLAAAKADGRLLEGNNLGKAASFFRRFDVHALLLLNIEPNIRASDLLTLMVEADVHTAHSLVSVDWRALVMKRVKDRVIGMTTFVEGSRVISGFGDAGDYVQELDKVRELFRPTIAAGHAMRRTTIFSCEATNYFEVVTSASLIATRCVPGYDGYYFIRVPTPDGTDFMVLTEKKGFDRVLATFRTQACKDLTTARIVLRQANVTYSIAGTQVTPRIELTATQAEALAAWVVVYSAVQDAVAVKTVEAITQPSATELLRTSIWSGIKAQVTATTAGQMALGTASAVENMLGAYRRSIAEKTLDTLSDEAFLEEFGPKISVASIVDSFIQKWTSIRNIKVNVVNVFNELAASARLSWQLSFGVADLTVVAALLGIRFTVDNVAVLLDAAEGVARISGSARTLLVIRRYQRYFNWASTKAEKVWINVQHAQELDFQAACIDVVETFVNTFSDDPAKLMLASMEADRQPDEDVRVFEEQAGLPFDNFLTEVKTFLGKYNCRVTRRTAIFSMLEELNRKRARASEQQLLRMVHVLKEAAEAEGTVTRGVLRFSSGQPVITEPIPLRQMVSGELFQDIRHVFHDGGVLTLPPKNGVVSTLERLPMVGDRVDFTVIHNEMERLQPGELVNAANLGNIIPVSPDERGGLLIQRLAAHVRSSATGRAFLPDTNLVPWLEASLRAPGLIDPVAKIFRGARDIIDMAKPANWLMHIDGLAMGGKSAGVRHWISNRDLVVVPTNKLKLEWQESMGKNDPLRRASVVTMHKALERGLTTGYVFIDEAYAFDVELLQAIANRHHAAAGIITIGDGHQIHNVFSPTQTAWDPTLAPVKVSIPVTFCPWDVAAVYLSVSETPMRLERYYCGSGNTEGLRYSLSGSDVLVPGVDDLSIQGTQNAKNLMAARGLVDTLTSHESQGARSQVTVVHCAGDALQRDMAWLALAEQMHHQVVTVTRSRESTVFVVNSLQDLSSFGWVDRGVNGVLPNDVVFGGTAWDLVEPRTENDAVEIYVHEARIVESSLTEQALTDKITIGTVFADGEALAQSELRAHVELKSGVKLIDEGRAHSDGFDNYTIQPRDVPGADLIQALTRATDVIKPTPADFVNAERIVERLFEQVIDKKLFFSHLNNSRRCVLNRRDRRQVIDGCYAETESRMSTVSFAFLKPEFSKKASELPGELKAQGVITASDMQQAIFMDACDALTHAWARSMQQGKFSPVGFKEQDIDDVLCTFEKTWELDLEKQDSSHKAVHVLVACKLLELASEHLGLAALSAEIRNQRTVRMMAQPFSFVLAMALASGDPWTLIINKIMAFSSLVSVADLKDARIMQTGDDITLDRKPRFLYPEGLGAQVSANKGLIWKQEERDQRINGVTFISRGALPNRTVVYKALRTVLKYTARPRNRLQHESYRVDTERLKNASAAVGLQAYVAARCHVFGGDPVVVFDMWSRAIQLACTPFDELPAALRLDDERPFEVHSREVGCFGYALAHCVAGNVQAINAIASYPRTTLQSVAIQACKDNGVQYVVAEEAWAKRSRGRLISAIETFKIKLQKAFVVLYSDHAVAVTPKSLVTHTAFGKKTFTWKTLHVDGISVADGL